MIKIKEWGYLLFRPKWERRLYKLLRKTSYDRSLCLDTVLYDYCPTEERDGKIFKAGVDAMFIGWLGVFDAKHSAKHIYCLQAQEVVIGLEPMPDGTAPEFATHEGFLCNRTLREYLQRIAAYVSSENVSDTDRDYLKNLREYEYLGLVPCWLRRQKAVRKMIAVLIENGVSAKALYADNFSGADAKTIQNMKVCLRQAIGIRASKAATTADISNWATLIAYYASVCS